MNEEKKKKAINVYEVAGKVGGAVKTVGGFVIGVAAAILVTKGPDIVKNIKK